MENQNHCKGGIVYIRRARRCLLAPFHKHTSLPVLIYHSHPETSNLPIWALHPYHDFFTALSLAGVTVPLCLELIPFAQVSL